MFVFVSSAPGRWRPATKVEKSENKLTQSSVKNSFATGLTLSEEDALRASCHRENARQ